MTATEAAHMVTLAAIQAELRLTYSARPTIATPTFTPVPPTPTPRIVPSAPPIPSLSEHTWAPDDILVRFGASGGDGGGFIPFRFQLLANGQLYIFDYFDDERDYLMLEATLSRQETCQLLNTIDQAGFFQYDPSIFYYGTGPVEGGGSAIIEVSAWDQNAVQHPEFWGFVSGDIYEYYEDCSYCDPIPIVMPSVVDTYRLLDAYQPNGLHVSDNRQVVVFIEENNDASYSREPRPWESEVFSLAEHTDSTGCNSSIATFMGQKGEQVAQYLQRSGGYFTDAGRLFFVEVTYDIPEAVYSACSTGVWGLSSEIVVTGTPATMTCTPEDGLLPIPGP